MVFEKPKKNIQVLEEKIDIITEEIQCLKELISQITNLTQMSNVPIALIRTMQETFKCRICLSVPIKPPILVSKCCKVIMECESCINQWYSGPEALTKQCPACKHERGYNER